jgi:hypothetical protein
MNPTDVSDFSIVMSSLIILQVVGVGGLRGGGEVKGQDKEY